MIITSGKETTVENTAICRIYRLRMKDKIPAGTAKYKKIETKKFRGKTYKNKDVING